MTLETDTTEDEQDDELIIATLPTPVLQQIVTAVDSIAKECIVAFDDGLLIETMDPANVASCTIELDELAFGTFDGTGRIAVDTFSLRNFLDPGYRSQRDVPDVLGDRTTIEVDPTTKKLRLKSGCQTYTYAYLDPERVHRRDDIPDLDLPLTADIDGQAYRATVEYVHGFADYIRLTYSDGTLAFEGLEKKGSDEGQVAFDRTDDRVGIVASGPADTTLSTDYASDIARAIPEDTSVRLDVGDEFPVSVEYEIAAGMGTVTFMQAPRVGGDPGA